MASAVAAVVASAAPRPASAQDFLMLGVLPIGKPVPQFDLPPLQGRSSGLSDRDLRGEVSLVNLFASWCAPCREEHPQLMDLARRNVAPIHGLNYKDDPAAAARWLTSLGDPYTRSGADVDGRVGGRWMVRGLPETFVIDRSGRIAYVHVGVLDAATVETVILPLIASLNAAAP